jgi:hypothetical protein
MGASASKNRQEAWRKRLQAFASNPEGMGDEWGLFLKELGLTHGYYLAVYEVVKQGRWATAKYPRAYVKKAATLLARKMNLSIPHKIDTFECRDSRLVFMDGNLLDRCTTREKIEDTLEAENRENGKPPLPPMRGRYLDPEPDHEAREEREYRAEMIAADKPRLPHDWYIRHDPSAEDLQYAEDFNNGQDEEYIHVQPRYKLDLERLAREAGFDSWELKVLEYRTVGMSRDVALGQQPDELSRKALQAAWKRFDRTGLKRLQECRKKNEVFCPE